MTGRPAVVVVSYGSSALLADNLVTSTTADDLVVVVDNPTNTAERERVRTLATAHGWLLLEPRTNLGFGGGMNLGVAAALAAGATSLLLLNPDARISPHDAAALHRAALAEPTTLLAPRILRPDGSAWTATTMDLRLDDGTVASSRRRRPGEQVMTWASGACLALSAALWEAVGGFDEDYFLYWEDVDLSRRVHQAGGDVVVLEHLTAVHDEGGTHPDRVRGRAKSATYYRYNIRGRLLFAAKWLPREEVRRWRRSALAVAYGVLLQGGRRQLVTSAAPWVALVRGLAGGYRAAARLSSDGGGAASEVDAGVAAAGTDRGDPAALR